MSGRSRTRSLLAVGFAITAAWATWRVPRGIGPGPDRLVRPHPGVAVRSFDSRWIPVTTRSADILQTLRDLRLQTSTMWFRLDCSDRVYDRNEINLVFEGGTVWVAAGHPKPIDPPARCLDDRPAGR